MRWIICLLTLLAAGCQQSPKRKEQDIREVGSLAPAAWSATLPNVQGALSTSWLTDLRSTELKRIVEQALASNRDLRAAAARVREAQAQARAAGASLMPQVDTDFSSSRSQRPAGTRFEGVSSRSNRFETGLNVSWELDVWGRVRDGRSAAAADAAAAAEDEHHARLLLAANVVKAAVSVYESERLLALASQEVEAQKAQLSILNKQLERGLNAERGALDVSLSQADLARSESTVHARRRELDAAKRSLEVLLGSYPSGKASPLSQLPTLSTTVPAGLPSELLLRRPDLRAAERRLDSALKEESRARKAFLPSFRLTTGAGYSSEELTEMLSKDALLWSLAGSVAQSIFQGGRLKANVDAARARYDLALETYAQSALDAFAEVETALAADRYWADQVSALRKTLAESERAEALARSSYERGLSDILTLLDSFQRAASARSALVTAEASRVRNRVDLHLALGGSF